MVPLFLERVEKILRAYTATAPRCFLSLFFEMPRDESKLASVGVALRVSEPGLIRARNHLRHGDNLIGFARFDCPTDCLGKHIYVDGAIEIEIEGLLLNRY